MSKFDLRYLIVPEYIYRDNRISGAAMRVYGFIHSYTNPFYFTNEQLGKMFNCSEKTITRAMQDLEGFGYIKIDYKTKHAGGTTRLAIDLRRDRSVSLDGTEVSSRDEENRAPTGQNSPAKDIKDNILKSVPDGDSSAIRIVPAYKKVSYLENISDDDLKFFIHKYSCTSAQVREMAERIINYCQSKGKRYKDYKATLRIWLSKEYGVREFDGYTRLR